MVFLHSICYGQTSYQFRGRVLGENNQALAGASVVIDTFDLNSVTDNQGYFNIVNIPYQSFEVEISFVGYETLIERIRLVDSKIHTFQLEEALVKLEPVKFKGNHSEKMKKKTPLNMEVVNDEYVKKNLGGSLMKSLERLPGVTTIEIGSGQSKPVIRGLSFNRVLVVENNVKHEAQQWGTDHGLEIDQYAVDNIEIIKGPVSLMYGSDAIGGVINISNNSVPSKNSFGGTIDLSGKTNNDFWGSSVSLFARKELFFITARATLLDYGDYRVPTDSVDIYNYRVPLYNNQLRNTAGKEQNLHTSFGILKEGFSSKFFISNVHSKSGYFANAHGLEPRNVDLQVHDASNRDVQYPYFMVNHFKAINRTSIRKKDWKLETDIGYQRNYRQEWSQYVQHGYMPAVFPETLAFNPEIERQFQKDIYSATVKWFLDLTDSTQLITGMNGEYKENGIAGRGFIIPAFKQTTFGGFVVAKHSFSKKSHIQAGIRYDVGNTKVKSHYDWFVSPIDSSTSDYLQRAGDLNRDFSNLTWSLGYNYNPGKWSYKFNIGKSFRMPIAKELAANGVNYHRFSYEVGNADLSPEISYQLDVGVEYSSKKFAIGASPFANFFTNYIYLNPTSRYDRLYGFGNQVFEYTESEVLRYGGELHAHYEWNKNLRFGFIAEYVFAKQLSGAKNGFTLPFAPPASSVFNVNYEKPKMKFVYNPYISLDYRLTANQKNIVPPEQATDGFQVLNLKLGGDLKMGKQKMGIALQVQNLLNARYFNHTSYYRLINVPEAGRNFIINITIPFEGKEKDN